MFKSKSTHGKLNEAAGGYEKLKAVHASEAAKKASQPAQEADESCPQCGTPLPEDHPLHSNQAGPNGPGLHIKIALKK